MQIVIDIPEDDYNFVKKQVADGITNPLKMRIANGALLPKGHGRLIDLNDLYDFDRRKVEYAPTIIEAEKED